MESGTFSDDRVQDLSRQFVCVKIDPRETRDASHLKTTRFVPEIVFLAADGRALGRLDDFTVEGTIRAMQRALDAAR